MTRKPLPRAVLRPDQPDTPEPRVLIPIMGVANNITWEEHMELATRGMTEEKKAAMWAEYGARRAERLARDVTPRDPKA